MPGYCKFSRNVYEGKERGKKGGKEIGKEGGEEGGRELRIHARMVDRNCKLIPVQETHQTLALQRNLEFRATWSVPEAAPRGMLLTAWKSRSHLLSQEPDTVLSLQESKANRQSLGPLPNARK